MKKTLIALMMAAAGALFPGEAKAENKKPKFNLWAETFNQVDTNGSNLWQPRIEVSNGDNSYFFRADYQHTHDRDAYRIGSRLPVDFDVLRGEIGAFGSTDSDDNHGIGVEFDGDLLDFLKVSGSLEKTNGHQLKHVMIGKDFPFDLTAKLGYFNKDGKSHLNGAAWQTFDDQYLLGVGGRVDEEGKGFFNACFGRYAKKKGEGIGWRVFGQTDFDGNWCLDGILTLGNKYSKPSFAGLLDPYKGGPNDPGIVSNIADYRPSSAYGYGDDAVLRFKVSKQKGQPAMYFAEAHYNFGRLGPVDNIRAGASWQRLDTPDAKDLVSAVFSAEIGPLCAEYVLNMQQGKGPVHNIWFGTSLNGCIDYARKQLE